MDRMFNLLNGGSSSQQKHNSKGYVLVQPALYCLPLFMTPKRKSGMFSEEISAKKSTFQFSNQGGSRGIHIAL